MMGLPGQERSSMISSVYLLDTMHKRDRQTDRLWTPADSNDPASCGKDEDYGHRPTATTPRRAVKTKTMDTG